MDGFVIGHGFVGKSTMLSLDIPNYYSRSEANITLEQGAKMQFCFICLPTPTNTNGGQEEAREVIRGYIRQLKEYGGRNIFVIRSTVLPGTCRALAEEFDVMVVSNPELLSEDTWEADAIKPKAIIIGADSTPARIAIENAWKHIKCKNRIVTDTVTSETMKYAFNTFFATKIVFANQLYDICQINGADYNVLKEALYAHPWGTKHHLKVIHKNGRGAAGHCLPKDLKAFSRYANSDLLKEVERLNNEYLSKSGKV